MCTQRIHQLPSRYEMEAGCLAQITSLDADALRRISKELALKDETFSSENRYV